MSQPTIHDLAFNGDVEGVKLLCNMDCSLVHSKTPEGNTPLHMACWGKHIDVVRELLLRGADPNLRGRLGRTPLHYAVHEGGSRTAPILELLLECNADADICDNAGYFVADWAKIEMASGLFEVLDLLQHAHERKHMIHHLARMGHIDKVWKMLCEHPELANATNDFGNTLLHTVCYFKQVGMLGAILSCDIDINARGYRGRTALHLSVQEGRAISITVVGTLLLKGADRGICDDNLFTAAEWTKIEMREGWAKDRVLELLEGAAV